MWNRRDFLRTGATGLAGGLVTCSLTASPLSPLFPTSRRVRTTMRWTGAGLQVISPAREDIGDFVIFTGSKNGRLNAPFDLFVRIPAPGGQGYPTILSPLGRHQQAEDLQTAVACWLQQLQRRSLLGSV